MSEPAKSPIAVAPAPTAERPTVYMDLSGVGSAAARMQLKERVRDLGLSPEYFAGVLEKLESSVFQPPPGHLVVVGDLSRLVASFEKGRSAWQSVWRRGRAYLVACVRGRRDEAHAALVDDLIRYLGPRVMVCDYDDVAVFDRCIERAFASTDPMAIVDVRVSLEGPTLRVEFGDGMHAVVAWDRLALNEVEPRLRPETAAVGQSSFSIEVLNEEGEVFEIDSMVVRALDDASLAQQIADVAESARRELGARLRGKREERGVTQQELAKLTGQQQSLLSKLENGRHQPTYATLEKYAAGLKLSVPELLG